MKYFTIDELCASDVAWARNIPNHPTSEARENLTRLIDRVLDPIREAWGGPVTVTSGFHLSPNLRMLISIFWNRHTVY